jgi:hypothetical protein
MFQLFWLATALVMSVFFSWMYVRQEQQKGDNFIAQLQWLAFSVCVMVIGLTLSWNPFGSGLLRLIQAGLPQSGSVIASLTLYVAGGLCGLLLVIGIPAASTAFFYFLQYRLDARPAIGTLVQ